MAASFSLIIEDDAGKQIVVPFAKDVITIGRKEGNTIRLTERNVSRFHAKLEKNPAGVLVEDLSSFNGVKLNGDRIAGKVLVSAGDVIEIGDYHLELRAAQAAKAAAGPVGSKAGAVQDSSSEPDDFEGDTQRWEPPPAAQLTSLGTATQEDTVPHTAAHIEAQDTAEMQALQPQGELAPLLSMLGEAHSWPPPPQRTAQSPQLTFSSVAADLEPTGRHAVADVPMGSPALSPGPAVAVSLTEQTQDLRVAPGARKRPTDETEQIRVAPNGDDLVVPRLVVLNTIFAGSTFPLKAVENVLGRTDDNDIVLEHRSVSRNHAKLVREGERVRILDLKSANGVLVNGEEVEQHVLTSGDIIELGRLKIRFVPVGERFVVPADEIERARVLDAAGDDNLDEGTQTVNISPLRIRGGVDSDLPTIGRPLALYAVFAVLGLAVVALIIAIATGGDDESLSAEPPTEPSTPVGVVVEPVPVPPVVVQPPTDVVVAPTVEPPLEPVIEPVPKDERPKSPMKKREKEVDFEGELKTAQTAVLSGEHKRAVEILKELEKISPKDPRIHRNLGISYARLRENANASKHYRRYLELNPTAPDADKVREILAGSKGKDAK